MKNTIKTFLFIIIALLAAGDASSQVPSYTLTAKNFDRSASDSLTFEVYLLHTNPGTTVFKYPAAQYFFRFNPAIANGGTLKYRVIGTGLPPGAVPQNASVSGTELRLASNLPVPEGSAPVISSTDQGTLIVKMSLKTSASSFDPTQSLNLTWRNSNDPPLFTKISAYVGMFIQEITSPETHSVDTNTVSINQISSIVPSHFGLFQNYPNPFNPSTKIKFEVPKLSDVRLTVFDITGRELEVLFENKLVPGSYEFLWDASSYSSGAYFYRLQSGEFVDTRRMLLIK